MTFLLRTAVDLPGLGDPAAVAPYDWLSRTSEFLAPVSESWRRKSESKPIPTSAHWQERAHCCMRALPQIDRDRPSREARH